MKILDESHEYELTGEQVIKFIKRVNGNLIFDGTTNEELLEVILDRTRGLDSKFPCIENKMAISFMELALAEFNKRTKKRVEQNVETKDIAHVS
jgi:hypothetical protein